MKNDITLILKAASFAAERHRNQLRKDQGATPYINHPLEVARILADEGGVDDPEVIAAALLHDTIEDTQTTAEELTSLFGERVSALVSEVTDDKALDKEERKRLQIEHAPYMSPGATLIKLGDKITNIRDVGGNPPADWDITRRKEYVEWAQQVVKTLPGDNHSLVSIFEASVSSSLALIEANG